jgi:PAS domain S-box-containing protein
MQQMNWVVPKAQALRSNRLYLYLCLVSSFVILLISTILSSELARSVSNFYLVAIPISVVIVSLVVLKKYSIRIKDGKLVLLFTVFAAARSCAEIIWIVRESILLDSILPSEADILWFAGYGALFSFFTLYLKPIKKSIPKNIHVLAIILAGSFLVPSAIGTISLQGKSEISELAIALMYPICDSIALYYVILGMVFLYNGRKNEFFFLLLLAIISITISDTFFVTLFSEYQSGNLIDIGWIFGYLFLAFAIPNFKSLSQSDSFQRFFHVEGKNIIAPIRFETIVRFVIPFVVGVIAMISVMVVVNDQYLDRIYNNDDKTVVDVYLVIGLLVSASSVILFINHKLFYLVRSRTVELESERDVLKLQIREKNDVIQKSKLLEERLEKVVHTLTVSEQRYHSIYDGSNDLYCTIDSNGAIINCNESFAKSLRFAKDDLIGKAIFDYLAEKSVYDMNMTFATWISTGTTVDREIWLKRSDETVFPTLFSMVNLYDKDGNLVGSNATMKDITVQKAMSDQLLSALTDLQKTEKLKDEFLAMVSHELKTPLVPIIGYCDILTTEKLGPLNEEQKKRLQILYSSGLRLRRMVNDILDVQKITLGQMRLNKQKHNLKEIIRDTIEDFLPSMEERHIIVKLNEKNETSCMCDKTRIQQVLGNLIRNSIDFCPKTNGKIIIHVSSDEKNAKIVFEDNGKGIPKEKIQRLFVKFYQIDTSSTREHGGTGLGLSICKGIIEEHGGRIWAESEGVGKGTQIHIEIPLKP